MKKYQKTAVIEVIGHTDDGDFLVQNEGQDNDQWVIPSETFARTYEEVKQDFGWSIRQLKAGNKVARKGWNGKGIFIELQVPDEYSKMTHPYIFIDTTGLQTENPDAPKSRVPWLASQTDMLAEDWEVVE